MQIDSGEHIDAWSRILDKEITSNTVGSNQEEYEEE